MDRTAKETHQSVRNEPPYGQNRQEINQSVRNEPSYGQNRPIKQSNRP
jgi:hypothetical protein